MHLTTVAELSKLIHKAVPSIYSDLIRNPKSLPPVFRILGSRKVFFKDVDIWLASLILVQDSQTRKPGRPTKKDQIAKRHSVGGAK